MCVSYGALTEVLTLRNEGMWTALQNVYCTTVRYQQFRTPCIVNLCVFNKGDLKFEGIVNLEFGYLGCHTVQSYPWSHRFSEQCAAIYRMN